MGRYLQLALSAVSAQPRPSAGIGQPVGLIHGNDINDRNDQRVDSSLPDLSKVLPPLSWLTPKQRRQWRERAAAYLADGMSRAEAEQEAMAELIWTGRLFDPSKCLPWP